jgi:hypothetical protein
MRFPCNGLAADPSSLSKFIWRHLSRRGRSLSFKMTLPVRRHAIVALHAPSAQLPHPVGDGPPDLVGRIFLDEMDPRNGHLGLSRPRASGVEIRAGS